MRCLVIDLAEKGILPDFLIRSGIRRMQKERLLWEKSRPISSVEEHHQNWVDEMKKSSIAYVPEKANEQHYEVPPAFFENALGKHLKYSSGYWPNGIDTLDDSELAMLKLSVERAELSDGIDILELGCGWGSAPPAPHHGHPSPHPTGMGAGSPAPRSVPIPLGLGRGRGLGRGSGGFTESLTPSLKASV